MSRIPERWDGPNEWYFVSVATRGRKPTFSDKNACISLINMNGVLFMIDHLDNSAGT
jgi:hypothetical protein